MCIILRVHRNHSLCLSIPNFTDLIWSVLQETRRQKFASILTYMCCTNSNLKQIPCSNPVHIMNRPYMFSTPRTKPSKSGFHLYKLTIHCVRPYPNLLTLYVQYTKILTVKKWLPFELICAVYLEYIVTIHCVRPYPMLLVVSI